MKIVRDLGTLTFQFQNTLSPPPPKIEIKADLGTLRLFSFRTPPPKKIEIKADLGTLRLFSFRTMCGKLPHVETLSSPDNYSFAWQPCSKIFGHKTEVTAHKNKGAIFSLI